MNIIDAIIGSKLNGGSTGGGGGSGGSGGVQPDWNQNDATATDYVKNRPFYSEECERVVLEGDLEGEGFMSAQNNVQPSDGQAVTIVFNGERHGLTLAFESEDNEYVAKLPNDNTLAVWHSDGEWSWDFYGPEAGTVRISVSVEQVKKLDAKYLPDGTENNGLAGAYVKRYFDIEKFLADCGESDVLPTVTSQRDTCLTKEDYNFLHDVATSGRYLAFVNYIGLCGVLRGDGGGVNVSCAYTIMTVKNGIAINDYSWIFFWDEDNQVVKLNTNVNTLLASPTI